MKITFQEIDFDLGLKNFGLSEITSQSLTLILIYIKKLGMCQHLILLPHTPKNAITEFVFRTGLGIKYGHLSILPLEKKTTTR